MVLGAQGGPGGRGMSSLQHRFQKHAPVPSIGVLTKLTEEEFVSQMREDRASEHMIEQELVVFRQIKLEREQAQEAVKRRYADKKNRDVPDEGLQRYVDALLRRKNKGKTDESRELKDEDDDYETEET